MIDFSAFAEELQKIAASMSELNPNIMRPPKDTLDRRSTRNFRKPNVRFLPLSTASGKIVK